MLQLSFNHKIKFRKKRKEKRMNKQKRNYNKGENESPIQIVNNEVFLSDCFLSKETPI